MGKHKFSQTLMDKKLRECLARRGEKMDCTRVLSYGKHNEGFDPQKFGPAKIGKKRMDQLRYG